MEIKTRSSKVHHHTTKNPQNGVETKEGATIRVYSPRHRCTIQARNEGRGVLLIGLKH
jgi:hypothetical protein